MASSQEQTGSASGAAAAVSGTIRSVPFRVGYLNGDWERAREALAREEIPVKYQTVASVEPHTATIHVDLEWGERAKAALEQAGVSWEKPRPYY